MAVSLGRVGIWAFAPLLDGDEGAAIAGELERLGYGALWLGGSPPADLAVAERLLDATSELTVATGIVNIWNAPADEVAKSYHRIAAKHRDRFLLGVGIGHPEATQAYARPYETIIAYLDALDEAEVPTADRALAALGPRVMRLAGERTVGAHPYLTTPEHTRQSREIIGSGPLLAPEHKVVMETDGETARGLGRPAVRKPYLGLRNYQNSLLRLGYTESDIADGGSDRLIDDLVAWGKPASIAARLTEHLDAGADHVTAQVITGGEDPKPAYRALAAELF
jgi:probable F420-dependent oxidoreductase